MDCGSRSAMGDVPSRRRALEVPVASFSGPLASSLAVRSVRHPPRRSCSGIEILPSVNLATHIVDAELPGEVTPHAGVEYHAGELELDAAPAHEAGAADH